MSKPIPISTPRSLEDAAHFHDIQQRAKLARPVEQGRDILRAPVDGMDERFGFAADSRYLKD